jgi:hypothetical protein
MTELQPFAVWAIAQRTICNVRVAGAANVSLNLPHSSVSLADSHDSPLSTGNDCRCEGERLGFARHPG